MKPFMYLWFELATDPKDDMIVRTSLNRLHYGWPTNPIFTEVSSLIPFKFIHSVIIRLLCMVVCMHTCVCDAQMCRSLSVCLND